MGKSHRIVAISIVSTLLGIGGSCAGSPAVAGVVGTGTAASCTEAALQTQIDAGGTITFDCGGPATIAMTTTLGISATIPATVVDGAGIIRLDGTTMPSPQSSMIYVDGSASALPDITLRGLIFVGGNAATGGISGGAIYNAGLLTLDQDVFSNNQAYAGGAVASQRCTSCLAASLTVTNSQFSNNTTPTGGTGAAIVVASDNLNVSNSSFTGNSAEEGGAIYLYANAKFTASGTITSSTFSGNTASYAGGAIEVGALGGGSATITNSTFNANHATGTGTGGAIAILDTTTLLNDTIAGNSAASGGAVYNDSVLTMQDTLLANNTGGNCAGNGFTGANNLQFGDSTCSGVVVGDPKLGALANNGGSTQTMALGAGSAAIDAGNNSTCAATDQRGVARPQGANCDIGAYEAAAVPPPPPVAAASAPMLGKTALLLLAGLLAAFGLLASTSGKRRI